MIKCPICRTYLNDIDMIYELFIKPGIEKKIELYFLYL